MAVSDRKIGLPELMAALNKHHARLEEHCERTERFVLEDELRGDIEKLNVTYLLLKWWRELRNQLERLRGHFSACLAEAARFRSTAAHTLDPIGRMTIENALEQCQQPLKNLTLRIQDSTEHQWKRSDDKYGQGGSSQLDDLVKDLQEHHKSIRENLKAGNFGDVADVIGEFGHKLNISLAHVDSHIEKLAEEIGEIAGGLQREAHKMARESRDEHDL